MAALQTLTGYAALFCDGTSAYLHNTGGNIAVVPSLLQYESPTGHLYAHS